MFRTFFLIVFLICLSSCVQKTSNTPAIDQQGIIDTIAFGSCANEHFPQPIWQEIGDQQPDLFLFLGDNVYADVSYKDGRRISAPVTDPLTFSRAYNRLAEEPNFAAFRKRFPMLATWDDHDYGANDQGKEYALKEDSKKAFTEFFNLPPSHPIHDQEGIYHSQILGPKGKKVQLIFLDTRYNRDKLKPVSQRLASAGPYQAWPDSSKLSVLGETQWQWLESQLRKQADVRIIASSIQFVAYEHGWESWGLFPRERQRFYELIKKTSAAGVIIVSGDRHLMEISVDEGQKGHSVPYPIWDFTASGLNESQSEVKEQNSFRRGKVARETNYGLIKIKWATASSENVIELLGKGENGRIIVQEKIPLSGLQPK